MASANLAHLLAAIPEDQRHAARRPLPGIQPLAGTDWITVDAAYGAQMGERARLLATCRNRVLACLPEATSAAGQLLDETLALMRDRADFDVAEARVTRPDGVTQAIDRNDPLGTLGHLVAEDLCLMQESPKGHVLTAAILCFPASWTLAEKIGKPLAAIHSPVHAYDKKIARRTQRLFDGVRAGRPIWRANLLRYGDPALFQPRSEADPRDQDSDDATFERSEKQVIWRLARADTVVFTIHTSVARCPERGETTHNPCQKPHSPL